MNIAITGYSMLSSVGTNAGECFAALCRGRSGLGPHVVFDGRRYELPVSYEVADREGDRDRPARASRWLARVVRDCLAMARLEHAHGLGAIVGTGLRELRSLELWWRDAEPLQLEQLHFESELARSCRTSATTTICNACAAGSYALAVAEDMLCLGQVDKILVAGTDSISESMVTFTDRVGLPGLKKIEPFQEGRKGVILGEGAVSILLEREEAARERGATIHGLLRGVGLSCDARHETAPDVDGMVRAMTAAHQRSGISAREVDLVLAHGTGTALNDVAEAIAMQRVFASDSPAISAIKALTGHTSGGSSLMSLVMGLCAMSSQTVPGIFGLTRAIPEADGLNLLRGTTALDVRLLQVNAFGFGGLNSAVVVESAAGTSHA